MAGVSMRASVKRGGTGLAFLKATTPDVHTPAPFVIPLADTRRAKLIEEQGADEGMAEAERLRHEERAMARAVRDGAFRQRKGGGER